MKTKAAKKNMTVILSLLLVAVLAIGATLAWLSQRTNDRVNNFTVAGDLDVDLDEEWDPDDGENITPGDPITKEPFMVNNSGTKDVYVAMQFFLTKGGGTDKKTGGSTTTAAAKLNDTDYVKLYELLEFKYQGAVGFNPAWEEVGTKTLAANNGAIFMYDTTLGTVSPGNKSADLFDTVTLKTGISAADLNWIQDTLGGFDIYLCGAAVHADGTITVNEAETELISLLP